tara:strand:+ start:6244 stop:7362 length:1119 start_codon:yes stop_codon:yes gene_type:complete
MIEVKRVKDSRHLKQFVLYPFELYKGSKFWVPPIIQQEIDSFNKDLNPNLRDSQVDLFLAFKNKKVVGRIAVIINWFEVKEQKIKKVRFGWFDFNDDKEISKKLLEKVVDVGKRFKLKYIEGPMGFSNLDKVGVLTSGFDIIGTMITTYNHKYYQKHYEYHGLRKEKNFQEKTFMFEDIDHKYYEKMSRIVKMRNKLEEVNFNSTSEVMKRSNEMFDLFNESYANLSSFVKINEKQKEYMKEKYLKFINPEYIKFVENENKDIVAFAIIMPSFARALQKIKGKLFPFGFLNLLWAKKFNRNVTLYLIGIHPEYQKLGVTAIIFNSFIQTLKNKGIQICRRTPELVDNVAIDKIWKNFNPKLIKTRSTFKKNI